MLRIKIELVPYGNENQARILHTVFVGNTGGSMETGNYSVWVDDDPRGYPEDGRPKPSLLVKNYERNRGASELTRLILAGLKKSKNKIFNRI